MPDGGATGPKTTWLDRALPAARPDGARDARVAQMWSHSNKGEYEQAARIAEAILDEGAGDAQVLSRYLFGVFLARGFEVLPRVLDALGRAREAARASGEKRGATDAELALGWLCRTVRDRVEFHQTQKDAVWRAWVDAANAAVCDAVGESCARLAGAVGDAEPGSRALESIAAIGAFTRDTLRGLVPRPPPPRPPPPVAPAPEPEEREATPPPPPVRTDPVLEAAGESPAMQTLRRKLAGFQTLVDRGDLHRASIVARDLEGIIERFDPRVYLPHLFAPYFRRLASSGDALAPYWGGADSPGARALEQLYLVDLEAFLEKDGR